jgi:hypothetical protein
MIAPATPRPPIELKDEQVGLCDDQACRDLIPGEFLVASIPNAEDVKVHPGMIGQLDVTNLRLIWHLPSSRHVTLSIGYATIINCSVSNSIRPGSCTTEVLFLRCKLSRDFFEFIFSTPRTNPSCFGYVKRALANHAHSTPLRQHKLRTTMIRDNQLVMQPGEQVMVELDGLLNFSKDGAKTGKGMVTNYRFVWHSLTIASFNVSIPLILLPSLRASKSERFGRALYLPVLARTGKHLYGFTMTPPERLIEFARKLEAIRVAAVRIPRLTPPLPTIIVEATQKVTRQEENLEFCENDSVMRYLPCDLTGKIGTGTVAFDKSLGLTVERPPNGDNWFGKWQRARLPLDEVSEQRASKTRSVSKSARDLTD